MGINKKIMVILTILLSLVLSLGIMGSMKPAAGFPHNILHVDQAGNGDFLTIQNAINAAQDHDTIYIHSGLYYETIIITKSLTLQGEDTSKVIIDGKLEQSVINITADDVSITGLTIRNSGTGTDAGIKVHSTCFINITNCKLYNNYYGIWFFQSSNNTVSQCSIYQNFYGILIYHLSQFNTVNYCQINNNNNTGIYLCCSSRGNIIHHCDITSNKKVGIDINVWDTTIYLNNFIHNGINARSQQENHWDYQKKGNYWSDYDEQKEGAYDKDADGIIDSPYYISEGNNDHYPFITQVRGGEGTHDTPGFLFLGLFFAALTVFLLKKNQ